MSKSATKITPQTATERALATPPLPEKRISAKQDKHQLRDEEDTRVVIDADELQGNNVIVAAASAVSEAPMVIAQVSTSAVDTTTTAVSAGAAAPAVSGWLVGLAALGGLALVANGGGSSTASAPNTNTNGGGGSSTPNTNNVSGTAIDGYLVGAKVYLVAANGVKEDTGVTTGADGKFTIQNPNGYVIQIEGGTNADTGLVNTVVLKAPVATSGSIVVTPLTTMIQTLVASNNMSPEAAENAVKVALGIDPTSNVSLTTLTLWTQVAAVTPQPLVWVLPYKRLQFQWLP